MTRQIEDAYDDEPPNNWGRWGEDDELGALNFLTEREVLRGVRAVEHGKTFTLGAPIAHPDGDPVWPGRHDADHFMVQDYGHILSGKFDPETMNNKKYTDDILTLFTHGTTHFDALGHSWYGDSLYNGFDQETTMGGLDRNGIEHMATHGIVGRGVLLDVPRHRGVDRLEGNSRVTLDEMRACAEAQGVDLEKRDVILLRTGATELWYAEGPEAYREMYERDHGDEPDVHLPGITYSRELVEWFRDMEIPAYCTDTLGFEQTHSETTGITHSLHPAFIRDLGIAGNEISLFGDLAADCADDGKYDFLFVAAPLRIVGGTGGPVNPVVVK